MTTYNTGNSIGSADPRDLYDNAQVIDDYANSESGTTTDRLGVERATIAGIDAAARAAIANAGYEFVGDYAAGIELTAYNQVVREAGEFWRVSGSTALPYTTTGAGMPEGGAFVSVGDAALRQDLVQPVATFNNVQDMKDAPGLDVGRKVRTLGYYAPGDGGGNDYEIVAAAAGTDDGGSFIDLAGSGLQANGLFASGVNIKQFGAKTTTAVDSTQAINNALIYRASTGGGAVLVPAGPRYRITNTLTIPSNVLLAGEGGQGASFIEANSDNFTGVLLDGTGAGLSDVFFGCSSAIGAQFGVKIAANRCHVARSKVFGYGKGVEITAGVFVVEDTEVTGFSVSGGVGVELNAPAGTAEIGEFRNLFVEGNATYRPASALRLVQCSGIQVSNSDLMQCSRGIQFSSDSTLSRGVTSIKCVNTYFDSNVLYNVEFAGDNTNRVEFVGCWASSAQYGIIFLDGSVTRGLTITGGEIYDNSAIGFQKRGEAALADLQINGTKFAGNGEDARMGNASNFILSGVHTGALGGFPASPTGFVIEASCSEYTMIGNRFHNITDNGTSKKRGYNTGLVTENFGSATVTPTENGTFDIPHGLVALPFYVSVNLVGDTPNEAVIQNTDTVNIVGRIRDTTTNADVTSGNFTIRWFAIVK